MKKQMRSKTKKMPAILALIIAAVLLQAGCGTEEEISDTGFYLDTTCTITLYDINKDEGERLIKKSFDICEKYERLMSKTIKGSDIDRINRAEGSPVSVSPETIKVIKEGMRMGKLSGGKFDITIGRVTELWDFNSDRAEVPADEKIKEAVETVDYRKIQTEGNTITLEDPAAKLDLGGIAKGYIADRITKMLVKNGAEKAIINLGGNVVAIGEKEENTPWNIGVERPYSDRSEVIGVVEAVDNTVVTSGIYERFFEKDGKKYHHILDPETGYPAQSDLEAVTVKGPSGSSMECDAISTVCILIGEKKAKKIIESMDGMEALFINKNNKATPTKGLSFVIQ
ncbi:MAG TPA: FAD:protein FMN transferase [Bacillota bacterium]|nr:FAD:protein FMN transferase [Bacillota bacterium]HUM55772.1 FAD:protein FMN transferase [Bacillota bacterium]